MKKLLFALIITSCLTLSYSDDIENIDEEIQYEKISINVKDAHVRDAFKAIEEQTGQKFIVKDCVARKITVRLQDVPWDQVVDVIVRSKGLLQEKNDNNIVITLRDCRASASCVSPANCFGYEITDDEVYYTKIDIKELLVGADPKTFKVLKFFDNRLTRSKHCGGGSPEDYKYKIYGIDKNSIYYYGKLIDGGDGSTFKWLGSGYARDKNTLYYDGKIVKNADPSTFKFLDRTDCYELCKARDVNHRIIDGVISLKDP